MTSWYSFHHELITFLFTNLYISGTSFALLSSQKYLKIEISLSYHSTLQISRGKTFVYILQYFCRNPLFPRGRMVERPTSDQMTLFKWGHGQKLFFLFFHSFSCGNDSRPLILYIQPIFNTFACNKLEKIRKNWF